MKQNPLKIESINIKLASPIRIRKWAERKLPNGKIVGEVTTSKTKHYRTHKPELGGLFCERIFGPEKDFECACGNTETKDKQQFCPYCDVEFTASRIRRYRLGYIKLDSPVIHIWYLKGRPSFLSILLNKKRKYLEEYISYTKYIYMPTLKYVKCSVQPNQLTTGTFFKNDLETNFKFCENKNVSKKEDFINNTYYFTKFKKNFRQSCVFKTKLNSLVNSAYYNSDITQLPNCANVSFIYLNKNIQISKFSKPNVVLLSQNTNISPFGRDEPPVALLGKSAKAGFLSKGSRGPLLQNDNSSIVKNKISWEKFEFNLSLESSSSWRKLMFSLNSFQVLRIHNTNLFEHVPFCRDELPVALLGKSALTYSGFVTKAGFLSKGQRGPLLRKQITPTLNFNSKKVQDDIQSSKNKIYFYYPVSSHHTIQNISESQLEDYWKKFKFYITWGYKKSDVGIPIYSNRIIQEYIFLNKTVYQLKEHFLTGTKAIRHILKSFNLSFLQLKFQHEILVLDSKIKKFQKKSHLRKFEKKKLRKLTQLRLQILRRLKIVGYFQKSKLRPEWMFLSVLPVLPPDLRPLMVDKDTGVLISSDLNKLYKTILDRNLRLKKYRAQKLFFNKYLVKLDQQLLQQAVDALIQTGQIDSGTKNERNYKSLSDSLKGKKGRFRNNLLGKRVDYSGRSVIVVAPELRLHECGLPKEMAIELFQPFILRELIKNKNATIIKAKRLIRNQDAIVWKILQKILKAHPILLNRAPTLHRLGIQAFQPKLIEGRAILLHPLVCPTFNADFDGDQMAVHIPLSFQARAEAWKLMWSRNNILSPATGEPVILPSQDMVLGCYYLTTTNLYNKSNKFGSFQVNLSKIDSQPEFQLSKNLNFLPFGTKIQAEEFVSPLGPCAKKFLICPNYFSNLDEVLLAFYQKEIALHSFIWVRWKNGIQIDEFNQKPVELRLNYSGNLVEIYSKYWRIKNKKSTKISQFIRTTPGRVLLNKTILQHISK